MLLECCLEKTFVASKGVVEMMEILWLDVGGGGVTVNKESCAPVNV